MTDLGAAKGELGEQLNGGEEYMKEYAVNIFELAEIEVGAPTDFPTSCGRIWLEWPRLTRLADSRRPICSSRHAGSSGTTS